MMQYEDAHGSIVLDPSQPSSQPSSGLHSCDTKSNYHSFHFSLQSIDTISPKHLEMMRKKAHLILRMLEIRIGFEMLLQVN